MFQMLLARKFMIHRSMLLLFPFPFKATNYNISKFLGKSFNPLGVCICTLEPGCINRTI